MTSPPNSGAGFCAACGAPLSVGARFCHRCGTPAGQGLPLPTAAAGAPRNASAATVLPWGVAFVALLALVANFAGKNFGSAKGSAIGGSANSLATSAIDGPASADAGAAAGPFAGGGAGPAPDISNMSANERAARLWTRAMAASENGQRDSASFFATMTVAAHEMIPNLTPDERFHFGLAAEILSDTAAMRAQADTILQQRSTSLLGLILAAHAAKLRGDNAALKDYNARLLKSLDSERATGNVDYEQHSIAIDDAVAAARKGGV